MTKKTARITISVDLPEWWGIQDMIGAIPKIDLKKEIIEMVQEDLSCLVDDGVWHVEIIDMPPPKVEEDPGERYVDFGKLI